MPHATDAPTPEAGADDQTEVRPGNAQNDDEDFASALRALDSQDAGVNQMILEGFKDGDYIQKADDAVDYGDISDLSDEDDLPEETQPSTFDTNGHDNGLQEEPFDDELGDISGDADAGPEDATMQDDDDNLDDLFGDEPSSPVEHREPQETAPLADSDDRTAPAVSKPKLTVNTAVSGQDEDMLVIPTTLPDEITPAHESGEEDADAEAFAEQQRLFQRSRLRLDRMEVDQDTPDQNEVEELLAKVREYFPGFDETQTPRFGQILRPTLATWAPKKGVHKAPKPVAPTKVNVELGQDQMKAFKSILPIKPRALGADQCTYLTATKSQNDISSQEAWDDIFESDNEDEVLPGGVTIDDLRLICADWDILEPPVSNDSAPEIELLDETPDEMDLFQEARNEKKRRKLGKEPRDFLALTHYDIPSFSNPEKAAARIGKFVTLDMNDPHLLLDVSETQVVKEIAKPVAKSTRQEADNNIKRKFQSRYNISNDEAYDMLKENHSRKVRSTLGLVNLEHAIPAVRLQYPYYKTNLEKRDMRAFHRGFLKFKANHPIKFDKPSYTKKKHVKGRDAKSLFPDTKSLSLGDNSNVLLIEYSEEAPLMLSNFGMGSKVINYYRRKDAEDTTRPKSEIGEVSVLLPQDKGPFGIFGHIDPGETTATITNMMYRAPVFRQEAKPTDFIVARNTTGIHGEKWYLRNVDNIYVSGQQFPLVEVPGPHSRKVTTAAKNRLKMISFRRLRRNKNNRIRVEEVTRHFPDTTDMQNRQKMKEFMQFSKEHKEWEMRPGEPIPGEDVLQSYIKPEDVCLLESMQVGQQRLHDQGFTGTQEDDQEEEEEDGKDSKKQSLEQQMTPWNTTKNFLNASQGKAMLQLYGEGDPTGQGQGFSFLKTSMKGGFKAQGESVADKIDAVRLKELGGHSYNVAAQQRQYDESIRRIWELQKQALSLTDDPLAPDVDMSGVPDNDSLDAQRLASAVAASEAPTPAPFSSQMDDSASVRSHMSTGTNANNERQILTITRRVRGAGGRMETQVETIKDQRVIKMYRTIKLEEENRTLALTDIKPTGNAEVDARAQKRLQMELARLNKNKERRHAREKQKGILKGAGSPDGPDTPGGKTATFRKCANCGQIGHIKTNKK